MAIFYDEYLNEGARDRYLKIKHKELKELDDKLDKNFDKETYDKRKKVANLINKYGGTDYAEDDKTIHKAKRFDELNKRMNADDYAYKNPYYWRSKSAEGKEKFMTDFGSKRNDKSYIDKKIAADGGLYSKIAMKHNKSIIKDAKSIKEACEYILSVIDESYDYNDYDDEY